MTPAKKPIYTAARTPATAADYCPGCGYYRVVHGKHRNDCTATQMSANPGGERDEEK
jgi:hypothetical protein